MEVKDEEIKNLKAMAYDMVLNIQNQQRNLVMIEQEILRRQQIKAKEIVDDVQVDIKEKKK